MVAPTTIGARLTQDGILKVNRGIISSQDPDTGFDEYTQSTHKITKTNVFADEFDEVTIQNHNASGGSISLNGSSRIELSGSSDFMFGNGNFTIEGWFYLTSTAFTRLWCFPNGDNVEVNNGEIFYWNGGGSVIGAGMSSVPQNTWFHVALVKKFDSGLGHPVADVYVNGTSVITDNSPYNSTASRALSIGGEIGAGLGSVDNQLPTDGWLNGKLTNFRVVKGIAVYTSNFSIPYTPSTDTQETVLLLKAVDAGNLLTDSSVKNKSVNTVGTPAFDTATPLTTVYNGTMKQLRNGSLLVANEFDETEVLS